MFFFESPWRDPYYNLALEEYLFQSLNRKHDYLMLWQNENSIIVGKYQNTAEEINKSYVDANGIKVARRLSGGDAVYHDLCVASVPLSRWAASRLRMSCSV